MRIDREDFRRALISHGMTDEERVLATLERIFKEEDFVDFDDVDEDDFSAMLGVVCILDRIEVSLEEASGILSRISDRLDGTNQSL